MLRELLSLFKSDDAVARMGTDFADMLARVRDLTLQAGTHYFEHHPTADERTDLIRKDVKVNKLERRIRKQVIAHLTLDGGGSRAPYGLLLMSLVKDAERIGDYAKNLSEVYDEGGGSLPEGDENADELRELRRIVETILEELSDVFVASDGEKAAELIQVGRDVVERADRLVARIAKGPYDAATTTTLVLGTRYYKRIASHTMNILSGIVMPLHKVDYYDEDLLTQIAETASGPEEDG